MPAPHRIVSLVPSQTELLAALGLDDEVVGLTRFCVHPEGWKQTKTIVGGTKNVDVERVLGLKPDLVIANREENEQEPVEALADVVPVHVTDVGTVPEALAMIGEVGRLLGRAEAAEALAAEIEGGFASLDAIPIARAAYLIWREPWMTVGGDTFISDVMHRAGLPNAFAKATRYPTVTADEVRASGAEVILLSSEPYPFKDEHRREIEEATGLPACLVDGEAFSWYGSRMRLAPPILKKTRQRVRNGLWQRNESLSARRSSSS